MSSEPIVPLPFRGASPSLRSIARDLVRLEAGLRRLERDLQRSLDGVASERLESARNLVHYLALRRDDLRDLQNQLSQQGLSSLGRSESFVMGSLLEVSMRVHEALALRGDDGAKDELVRLEQKLASALSWETAQYLLHQHTRQVLGPCPEDRHIYIMVTAPPAREADRAWMLTSLRAGMNVLRVNCAHEGEAEWARIIGALREASTEFGKECRVLMDLGGPKIRTGTIAGFQRVVTWKPSKDEIGKVVSPARVAIRRASVPNDDATKPFLQLGDEEFGSLRKGDELRFRDERGKKRTLSVHEVGEDEIVALATARAYVVDEVTARLRRDGEHGPGVTLTVGGPTGAAIDVKVGDSLILTARAGDGTAPRRARDGSVEMPGVIACTLPEALSHLDVSHRVLFDDGRIHAVVERFGNTPGDFLLRVTRTRKETEKLRAEKGINLPDTKVTVPSLSPEDLRALEFVTRHADAVGLSFARTPDDVRQLHQELDRLGRANIAVVLKIETRAGFENLPRMLLEGLRRPPLAVMIARGDLAVEVGFERLAELQEEILWLCEASHVPAIWATQVLDTLARTGVPSRAEVTDAAASVAAECVMLNKGPFVVDAMSALSDILRRMEKHHYKKRSLFRKLRVSAFEEP